MSDSSNLEVFQDLHFYASNFNHSEFRRAIIENTSPPWRHAEERENLLRARAGVEDGILALERLGNDDLPHAGLVLWPEDNGFKIVNIVPINAKELSRSTYNTILQDFLLKIGQLAATKTSSAYALTKQFQSIDHWFAPSTTEALRRFSALANKSTSGSHPLDRNRWLEFIVDAYRSKRSIDTGLLGRWLVEIEKWPEDGAHKLIAQYEFAEDLLKKYDESRE
ncbi:MAG TPA: hypothetical protein VF472_07375 [Burkholderiaceae bacterium]